MQSIRTKCHLSGKIAISHSLFCGRLLSLHYQNTFTNMRRWVFLLKMSHHVCPHEKWDPLSSQQYSLRAGCGTDQLLMPLKLEVSLCEVARVMQEWVAAPDMDLLSVATHMSEAVEQLDRGRCAVSSGHHNRPSITIRAVRNRTQFRTQSMRPPPV